MAGADHGVKLDPEDLVAAAHRAGPPGRGAHDALRHPPPLRPRRRRVTSCSSARCCGTRARDDATVWVADRRAVHGRGPRRGRDGVQRAARSRVEGHHYALVHVHRAAARRRRRRTRSRSTARSCGRSPTAAFPPSVLRTHTREDAGDRIVFGSCRVAAPHEPPHTLRKDEHPDGREVDALRGARAADGASRRPRSGRTRCCCSATRSTPTRSTRTSRSILDGDRGPPTRRRDFDDYVRLYRASWGEPVIRWLLSTVPSAMIFDDHDVHDDWNTSIEWVTEMRAEGWWRRRIVAAFESYLIYQHLGQPLAARAGRGLRALPARCGRRRTRPHEAARLRPPRRPRGRGHALELLPRHRPGARW